MRLWRRFLGFSTEQTYPLFLPDQNGTVHNYDFDDLGRQTHDRITTLGSGVDGAVLRISTEYEVRGLVEKITSHDNATVGSGSVVNEVQNEYNDFGQLTTQYQAHGGAVNTGTTPKVQYAYTDGSSNHIRPTKLTYPNGRIVRYEYGSATADDYLSRVSYLADDASGSIGTHLAEYTYLGLGMAVKVDYTEPDIRLDLAHGGGSDPYDGLDRFDRVQDLLWRDYGASADAVRIKHGYDRAGNRLWREDPVAAANSKDFDELYTYDGIYQLKTFQRGNLNGTKDGIVTNTLTFEQNWGFDPLGNWSSFKEDTDGNGTWNLDQTRTHNKVNEITAFTGGSWPSPAYDRNGNMTTMPQPAAPTASYTATYDAWNRLVKLVDPGTTNTVAEYLYDGQKWRIITKSYTSGSLSETRYHHHLAGWQVVEERLTASGSANRQFVWGLRYIDDLVLRDRDTDANSSLDERLYGMQDPNWNMVAIANTSGDVQERYAYDAYGNSLVLNASFVTQGSSAKFWETGYAGYRFEILTSLHHVRHRVLHSLLGRWVTRDPKHQLPLELTLLQYRMPFVQNPSLYEYAGSDPLGARDPHGLQKEAAPKEKSCVIELCSTEIKVAGGVAIHLFVRMVRSVGGKEVVWAYRGGPSGPDKLLSKCACGGGLEKTKFGQVVTVHAEYDDQFVDYLPKERENCVKIGVVEINCDELHECYTKILNRVNSCCIEYSPIPIALSKTANSNSVVYWMFERCGPARGALRRLTIPGQAEGKFLELAPGWGVSVPDCVKKDKEEP